MKTKLICFVLLFSGSAFGEKVLIPAPSVPLYEYQAFLKVNPQYQSAVKYWLDDRATKPSSLLKQFDEAEKAFLSLPIELAYTEYKKLAETAFDKDWPEAERKIIFHSFLRAAQSAAHPDLRKKWLLQSRQFDPRLIPDENVFPPPLIKEWRALNESEYSTVVRLARQFDNVEILLVNGRSINLKRRVLKLPTGRFRATMINSYSEPVTRTVSISTLQALRMAPSPLLAGDCQSPKWRETELSGRAVGLFEGRCLTELQKSSESTPVGPIGPTEFNPIAARVDVKTPAFYQSKTFWIVVGAVAGYAAYKNSAANKKEEPATHTTGF